MNPPISPLIASSRIKSKVGTRIDSSINADQALYMSCIRDAHLYEIAAASGLRQTKTSSSMSNPPHSRIPPSSKHIDTNFLDENEFMCRRMLSDNTILDHQLAVQALSNTAGYLPLLYDATRLAQILLTSYVSNICHLIGTVRSPLLHASEVTKYCGSVESNLISTVGNWPSSSRSTVASESQYQERASPDLSSHRLLQSVGCYVKNVADKDSQKQVVHQKTASVTCKDISDTNGCQKSHQVSRNAPIEMYRPIDSKILSEYQCFARKQMEFFEADETDVKSNAKGRNKPIVLGQVGIRCRHCSAIPPIYRSRGAMYYPTKKHLIYQAAQNMIKIHLHQRCKNVQEAIQYKLSKLHKSKCSIGGGKSYWDEGATACRVYEATDGCLRFQPLNESNTNKIDEATYSNTSFNFVARGGY